MPAVKLATQRRPTGCGVQVPLARLRNANEAASGGEQATAPAGELVPSCNLRLRCSAAAMPFANALPRKRQKQAIWYSAHVHHQLVASGVVLVGTFPLRCCVSWRLAPEQDTASALMHRLINL